MRHIIYLLLATVILWGFTSCEGCVKKVTKKGTKLGMSAMEGMSEAIDEDGEKLAEKATDAAGKLVLGIGKSLDKQLNEHAEAVASATGKIAVKTLDGLTDVLSEQVKTHYVEIPYTTDFASGITLDCFGKYKHSAVIDAYFVIPEQGKYLSKFECYDNSDKLFLIKEIEIDRSGDINSSRYTLVSFALDSKEKADFENVKDVKITVSKM